MYAKSTRDKPMKSQYKLMPCITILLIFILFAGCAVKTKMLAPLPQSPVLKYVMPEGQSFTYKTSSGYYQTISMMGVPLKTTVLKDMIVKFYHIAFAEDAYQLQMIIKDVAMKITAPGTDLTPNLSKLPGKTFEMTVTNSGEEIGLMGAEQKPCILIINWMCSCCKPQQAAEMEPSI